MDFDDGMHHFDEQSRVHSDSLEAMMVHAQPPHFGHGQLPAAPAAPLTHPPRLPDSMPSFISNGRPEASVQTNRVQLEKFDSLAIPQSSPRLEELSQETECRFRSEVQQDAQASTTHDEAYDNECGRAQRIPEVADTSVAADIQPDKGNLRLAALEQSPLSVLIADVQCDPERDQPAAKDLMDALEAIAEESTILSPSEALESFGLIPVKASLASSSQPTYLEESAARHEPAELEKTADAVCASIGEQLTAQPLSPSSPSSPKVLPVRTKEDLEFTANANTDGSYDVFLMYAPGLDALDRDNDVRVVAAARELQERGLFVCLQTSRIPLPAKAKGTGRASSDEAHSMVQVARRSRCAVLLLTRSFIERADAAPFGDVCVAGVTIAKRFPEVVVAAMEPGMTNHSQWGWSQVFARFSGCALADLSSESSTQCWQDGIAELAWYLKPDMPAPSGMQNCVQDLPFHSVANISATKAAVQPSERFSVSQRYDCYLSHVWTKDKYGRDNHRRVLRVAQHLRSAGLHVFFDEWAATHYRSIDAAMVDGMKRSSVVVIFVTRAYIDKVEQSNISDSCVAEYNLAKRMTRVIPVIMEKDLRLPSKWGWNRVYAHLSGSSPVDMCFDDGGLSTVPFSEDAQKWFSSLDALQLRVEEEIELSFAVPATPRDQSSEGKDLELQDEKVAQPLMTLTAQFVPMRRMAYLFGVCLICAAVSMLCAASFSSLDGFDTASDLKEISTMVACVCLMAAYLYGGVRHVQRARLPPHFKLNPLMLPRAILCGCVASFVGSVLLFGSSLFFLLSGSKLTWLANLGASCLFIEGIVSIVDIMPSHGRVCDGLPSFTLLQYFASGARCLMALFLTTAQLSASTEDTTASITLQFFGGLSLLISGALQTLHALLAPRRERLYEAR